jgi:hypothetical protein
MEIARNRLVDLGVGGVKIGHFFDHEPNEWGRQRAAALPKGPHSERITVADNEITRAGQLFPGAVGVFVGENPGNQIVHNHIHGLPWVGISVGSPQTFEPSQARDNIAPGTRIRYNVVHDIRHRDYGGWGIYTDQGSADILIESNLVYRCNCGPLFVSYTGTGPRRPQAPGPARPT